MCEPRKDESPDFLPVEVQERVLARNDRTAQHNREHFGRTGVLAINLMGSPGSGKTAILEATARALPGRRLAAVAGDLETHRDAERLAAAGIPSVSITTGSACHLDAELVHRALHGFAWREAEFLFIENVGNLVCPAVYDLGQAVNVVALAVTEGEDKPLKYPIMFRKADLVLVTKADLLPHLDVRLDAIDDALARVMPAPDRIVVSAKTTQGLSAWTAWLERERARRAPAPLALAAAPA
jgi:hydrogenase nickel incorporation protein HypB